MLSLPLLPPQGRTLHTLPLLQHGVPHTGDSSPQTAPKWSLPRGCSPSGTDCSSVGSPWGHKSCQQTCSSVDSSIHRSTGPARTLVQHELSMGSQSPSGAPVCSDLGSSKICRWISAPPWTSMSCRETTCLTMVFSMGCSRISAPVPGAPPPSPSSLSLVSAGLFLSHIHNSLFCCCLCSVQIFFFIPLLTYFIPEVLPQSLIGLTLASAGSVLEPADIGSVGHRGSF